MYRKKTPSSLFFLVLLFSFSQPATADMIFRFDADLEGFFNSGASSPVAVTHSANFGGSMRIETPGGLDTLDARLDDIVLNFAAGSPVQQELANAVANGGTISYQLHFPYAEQLLNETTPNKFEIALITEGAFVDRSLKIVNYPSAGQTVTTNVSFDIIGAEQWDSDATNSQLTYRDQGSGSLAFGLRDPGGDFEVGVFYVDNLVIAANVASVPEPSAGSLLAVAMVLSGCIRRKRTWTRFSERSFG